MNQKELISLLNPSKTCGSFTGEFTGLRLDSRKVMAGDIFVAIRGSQQDGHDFISSAIGNGASAVLAEQLPQMPTSVLGMEIANTGKALGRLAQTFYKNPAARLRLVGVTGTNGKTTVSTLVWQVLQHLGYHSGLIGTVSNYIGNQKTESILTTPDAIDLAGLMYEMAEASADTLCMEVSSHALSQYRTEGLDFQVAAFTNLSHDHLDYHKTFEAYLDSKKILFDQLGPESIAIINTDDVASSRIKAGCVAEIWPLSFSDGSSKILHSGTDGLVIEVDGTVIQSPLCGRFNAYNVAMAYLVATALGVSKSNAAAALNEAHGAEGRMQRVPKFHVNDPDVFVDYAHTPDAMENVLSAVSETLTEDQFLHVVFGCGGNRDRSKRAEMAAIAEKWANKITVTSDNPRFENPDDIIAEICTGFVNFSKVTTQADRKMAIENAISEADSATAIVLAGKGHESYQEIKGVRYPMDDSDLAKNALRLRSAQKSRKERA